MMQNMARDVESMKNTIKLMLLSYERWKRYHTPPTEEENEYREAVYKQAIAELEAERKK